MSSPPRVVALALGVALGAAACRQPSEPPVPPGSPLKPTNDRNELAQDDTPDASSITTDGSPKLDAASLGFDSGIPERR